MSLCTSPPVRRARPAPESLPINPDAAIGNLTDVSHAAVPLKGFSVGAALLKSRPHMQFTIVPHSEGDGFSFDVGADGWSRHYVVPTATQQDFNVFFREIAEDFGTRVPHVFARAN